MDGESGTIDEMPGGGNRSGARAMFDLLKNTQKFPKDEANWSCFLKKFRDLAQHSELRDPKQFKSVLFQSITGESFMMIAAHDPANPLMEPLTYQEYEAHLSSFFAPASESDLKKSEYLSKKQGKDEGILAYLATKYALFVESYPANARSESDFTMEAIDGMYSNAVKREVNRRSPISYKDLVEKASDVVAVARRAYLRGFGETESLDGLATSTTIASKALMRTATGETPMEIGAVEGDRGCWWCLRTGHFKRDCPVFRNNQPRARPEGRGGFPRGPSTTVYSGKSGRTREGGTREGG